MQYNGASGAAVGFTPDMIAGFPVWDPLVSYPAPYFVGFQGAVYEVIIATTPGQSPITNPANFKKITTPTHDQNTDLFLAFNTASQVSAATLRGIADRFKISTGSVRIAPIVNPSSAPYGLDIHGVRGIGYNGIQVLNFEGAASPYDDAILSFAIQGSNYRGMRLPRMTTASRNLISSPQTGLIIDNQSINNPQYRGASGWLDFALIEGPKTSRRFAYFNDNGYLRQTDYLTLYDTINNTDIKALAQFLNIISFDDNILISLRSPDYDLGGSIFNSSLFFVNKNKYSIPRTPKFTFFLGNTTQTNWQSSDRLGGFHITISASTNENDGTALLNGRSFWVNPDREVVIFDTPNWAPLTDAEIGNGFKMWSSGKVPHFRANGNTIKLQKSPTVPATLAEVITLLTNAGFC